MISILRTDFYKATHMLQYREGITHFTSYLTPRGSRFKNIDKMVVFGIANFVNKWLYEDFNKNFFEKSDIEIYLEVEEVLHNGLGYSTEMVDKTYDKIFGLWKLNYLPIEINGLPEGTLCPMQVPAIEIRSTHPDFAWVAQAIESILSCEIWHSIMSATVGLEYKKIAKAAFDKTVDDNISHMTAMCDFSMRGQESYDSAVASGAAFLASFYNCSTIESRKYIEKNYKDKNPVKVNGLTSTEHSVMCSDYAIGGDEIETYRRLLTEVYPNTSFAAVSDSYDFWNVVTNILPSLKNEIEEHEGFIGIRHDSDEPIHALCGIERINLNKTWIGPDSYCRDEADFEEMICDYFNEDSEYFNINNMGGSSTFYITYSQYRGEDEDPLFFEGVYKISPSTLDYDDPALDYDYSFEIKKIRDSMSYEDKGMVESLYELFGGTVNSKGYKVMNPKLKAVYGDSITIPRAKEIYKRLEENGFAANNVSLGVGSFSMECLEENGILKPFTRDSFSIAIKATYGRRIDEKGNKIEFPIFKNPKGCSGKKSLKGLCLPFYNENKELYTIEELNETEYNKLVDKSEFVNYFKNGKVTQYAFEDIRNRMEENCND